MRLGSPLLVVSVAALFLRVVLAEPEAPSKVLAPQSCSTSGCHGGAGLNRGAYLIWRDYDPHHNSAATLDNGQSRALAGRLGIADAAQSSSCTACHAPMRQVDPAVFASTVKEQDKLDCGKHVSCANCHGGAENWLLSHTRPRSEFPKDALARLGMRPLETAYERANNCVACHQNLANNLLEANHPPLVFELDGLLVAQPKHWQEADGFSHGRTWLVGQAVALREAAAQDRREPAERRRAEIVAIQALLQATGTNWPDSPEDLVRRADEYAKRISSEPMSVEKERAILEKLLNDRTPFQPAAFGEVTPEIRFLAIGHYAERLALAIDRLNESTAGPKKPRPITDGAIEGLFAAAKPPRSFDQAAIDRFLQKLDSVAAAALPEK
ncbi:cytochrome c family protein [Luteolibacter arcticus]|uniref:Cytochrome c family protein n=1 Tax=Luteolibacter arcticus TaxID=1581411 RepID=A0ABT3GNT8_9BACT|nr:cytochrome c family protein [Luteolibacter arcticus]MCW1925183.1 cytochrome c family protein [Luteolibacter arcticus]